MENCIFGWIRWPIGCVFVDLSTSMAFLWQCFKGCVPHYRTVSCYLLQRCRDNGNQLILHLFRYSIAAACWSIHYAKRLFETVFVHRFSHSTMPIMNLFKNCAYYWGFTAYVSYHVSHPLYTSPSDLQVYAGLAGFLVSVSLKTKWAKLNWFLMSLSISDLRVGQLGDAHKSA